MGEEMTSKGHTQRARKEARKADRRTIRPETFVWLSNVPIIFLCYATAYKSFGSPLRSPQKPSTLAADSDSCSTSIRTLAFPSTVYPTTAGAAREQYRLKSARV